MGPNRSNYPVASLAPDVEASSFPLFDDSQFEAQFPNCSWQYDLEVSEEDLYDKRN